MQAVGTVTTDTAVFVVSGCLWGISYLSYQYVLIATRAHKKHKMRRTIATDVPGVCQSAWLRCANVAESIEFAFGVKHLGGSRNIVSDGAPIRQGERRGFQCKLCQITSALVYIQGDSDDVRLSEPNNVLFGDRSIFSSAVLATN